MSQIDMIATDIFRDDPEIAGGECAERDVNSGLPQAGACSLNRER
jgi:hypothetical protein